MHHFNLPSEETHTLMWIEDDAPVPDKELVNHAWRRLYGEDYPIKHGSTGPDKFGGGLSCIVDYGDCMAYELRDGKIIISSFDGGAIWEPK